jgi:ADP-ribose pyrophosphatase
MTTYTHPDVFTRGIEEGWAEAETDPSRIDWAARQAVAAIPFRVVDGRPVSPGAPTGIRYGRGELGHWGEQVCADALVTLIDEAGDAWLLMVERLDGHGWALPGGKVDPEDKTPAAAAVRELAEETGLVFTGKPRKVFPARYVPDPRASDEAWMVTVPTWIDLGTVRHMPAVAGGDDARRAEWVRADSYAALVAHLEATYRGRVFAAHRPMLADLLDAPEATAPREVHSDHSAHRPAH